MWYDFFWVIPRCLNFICRRFRTLFHVHRQVDMKNSSYLPAYERGTDSVLKRWHIKFRCWGITQKKPYEMVIWYVIGIILTLYHSTIYFNDYNTVIITCNKYYILKHGTVSSIYQNINQAYTCNFLHVRYLSWRWPKCGSKHVPI